MTFSRRFAETFAKNRITMLGAGPMSIMVTEEIIRLANLFRKEIAMIPSRRQVDARELGGGYVNKWSTQTFTEFVRKRDKGGFVLLSRDHSGPWQLAHNRADGSVLSHSEAMDEVKSSLEVDIKCGFDLIHIDPSQGLKLGRSQSQVEDDALDLLEFCQNRATADTEFEIGADEQSSVPDLVHEAEENLSRMLMRIKKMGLALPMFYVLQTGTKVMETRNIGSFDARLSAIGMLPAAVQLPKIIAMCEKYGIFLKEHNADYLSDSSLLWHRRYGIHAANVAPEFGVVQTREFLKIAQEFKQDWFIDAFSKIVISGGKWRKWMLDPTQVTDVERVEIAGHYHFSDTEVIELLTKLERNVQEKGLHFEERVRSTVSRSIQRYLEYFGYGLGPR